MESNHSTRTDHAISTLPFSKRLLHIMSQNYCTLIDQINRVTLNSTWRSNPFTHLFIKPKSLSLLSFITKDHQLHVLHLISPLLGSETIVPVTCTGLGSLLLISIPSMRCSFSILEPALWWRFSTTELALLCPGPGFRRNPHLKSALW